MSLNENGLRTEESLTQSPKLHQKLECRTQRVAGDIITHKTLASISLLKLYYNIKKPIEWLFHRQNPNNFIQKLCFMSRHKLYEETF